MKTKKADIQCEFLYAEPFSESDFQAVKRLLADLTEGEAELTPERYAQVLTESSVFVVRDGKGTVIGMASAIMINKSSRPACSVEDVIVGRKFRRRGIGTALMKKIIWLAEQSGVSKLDLHTSRPAAARLYRDLKFKKRRMTLYQRKVVKKHLNN